MQKQFISLRAILLKVTAVVTLLLLTPFVTNAQSSSIQELLVNTSLFIKLVLVPVLFGIAFLFFLINMMKYFVIGGANEEARAKGRKNLLYSIIAFVFLISIWSIVSLLLNGLDIDSNSESLCPDYMQAFDGSCNNNANGSITTNSFGGVTFPGGGTGAGGTGAGGVGTGGAGGVGTGGAGGVGTGGTGTGGTGGLGTGGTGGTGGGDDSSFAGLAELVFGTGKDSALFTIFTGAPGAISQTPAIATTASCESGLNTLLFANTIETNQAAYVLYKGATGATRWQNITDLHSANHISYDKDALDTILASNVSDVHVIHTHQNTRAENLELIMEGHGPSAADMQAMCNNNDTRITYGIVDWNGIWTMTQQVDTCPYTLAARNTLPIIETYGALASTEASTRQSELIKYTDSSITPTQYKNHFSNINTQQFPSLTPEEVLDLSDSYQTYASTTIAYQSNVGAFCNTF